MTIKLDVGRSYGQIYGHAQAKYEQDGVLFDHAGEPIQAPLGDIAVSAVGKAIPKRDAVTFLRAMLADGAVPVLHVQAAAERAGFGWRTIQRAKGAIGAIAIKQGRGPWFWKAATKDAKPS